MGQCCSRGKQSLDQQSPPTHLLTRQGFAQGKNKEAEAQAGLLSPVAHPLDSSPEVSTGGVPSAELYRSHEYWRGAVGPSGQRVVTDSRFQDVPEDGVEYTTPVAQVRRRIFGSGDKGGSVTPAPLSAYKTPLKTPRSVASSLKPSHVALSLDSANKWSRSKSREKSRSRLARIQGCDDDPTGFDPVSAINWDGQTTAAPALLRSLSDDAHHELRAQQASASATNELRQRNKRAASADNLRFLDVRLPKTVEERPKTVEERPWSASASDDTIPALTAAEVDSPRVESRAVGAA
jgi:hypothetical protein